MFSQILVFAYISFYFGSCVNIDDSEIPLPICSYTANTLPTPVSACDIAKYGLNAVGPVYRQNCFPAWINKSMFLRGQDFFTKNWASFEMIETYSLVGLLSIHEMSDILLFTATNDCPTRAVRRYSTTTGNILLWGTSKIRHLENSEVILDSLHGVRKTHFHVGTRVRNVYKTKGGSFGNEDLVANITLQDKVWDALKLDLEAAYTPSQLKLPPCYVEGMKKYRPLNQFEYAMTQLSFAAVLTLDKRRGLVPLAKDDDIEAFNHWWAVVGYIMGIDDTYNIALQPNITEQRQYYRQLQELYVIPFLYNIDRISKYMVELTLERTTPYRLSLAGIKMPNFVPLDGQLMSTLSLVLNIPYRNLRKVSSFHGNAFIDTVEILANGGPLVSITQPMIQGAISSIHNVWGERGFGKCYRLWKSAKDKAEFLHYIYDGPDINPNGIYSNCSHIPLPC